MALPSDYTLHDEIPSVEDYRRLRPAAGLSPRSLEAARAGLPNTWAAAVVRSAGGEAVGMGRVIGDGGCFFEITDMAVDPGHQSRGIGTAILVRLLDRLREGAPPDAWVSLLADPPGRELYARHGFSATYPDQTGMGAIVSQLGQPTGS